MSPLFLIVYVVLISPKLCSEAVGLRRNIIRTPWARTFSRRACQRGSFSAHSTRPGEGGMPPGSLPGGEPVPELPAPPQVIPLKPKSTLGVALRESMSEDKSSFEWVQDEQIRWLSGRKDELNLLKLSAKRVSAKSEAKPTLVKKEMQEEHRASMVEFSKMVVDLLYNMVLFRFESFGIEPVRAGDLDGPFTDLGPVDLLQLTSGIHSVEAVEMVRTHLMSVLGPMLPKDNEGFYTQAAKLPKLQLAQVYMTSVMFGYFLRRVDRRYQVAKQFNLLDSVQQMDDSVERIELMLRNAGNIRVPDPDLEDMSFDSEELEDPFLDATDEEYYEEEEKRNENRRTITLKEYVERFDSKTLVQCASLLSQEAAILLQEYQYALFGNIRDLQREMAQGIGPFEEAQPSPETIMRRISNAVQENRVQSLVITFADQRRLVLEAVALGTFLRDSEDYIQKRADSEILTPLPPLPLEDGPIRGMLGPGN